MISDSVLRVQNLVKVYEIGGMKTWFKPQKPFIAVNGISFALAKGEILGLLGPNGAGKTTTIQMLLSTLAPTSGTIEYFGLDFKKRRSDILQRVGFASTYVSLPGGLTIRENLDIYGRLYGMSSAQRTAKIHELLTQFSIWDLKDKQVADLSAGQTTCVMLAKAFLADPKVVLLDEPTASLDPDVANVVRTFILRQQQEYGTSIVFASHNMAEVSQVCDRVLVLQKGTIIETDTPDNLAARMALARVQLLIGDGLKRTIAYAQQEQLFYRIDNRTIEISLDEYKIAEFLTQIAMLGVRYTQISIEKPTLEDYFLHISRPENHAKK